MKWPLIYAFLATTIVILGIIEKKVVYLIAAVFIYLITLLWLTRKT